MLVHLGTSGSSIEEAVVGEGLGEVGRLRLLY